MFESWKILFGNDRATGEEAFDPAEILYDEATNETPDLDEIPEDDCYIPRFESGDPVFVNLSPISDTENTSTPRSTTRRNTNPTTAQSETEKSSTPTSAIRRTTNPTTSHATSNAMPKPPPKKKSKLEAKESALDEAFGSYMKESTSMLGRIADGIGYDMKLSNKREGLFGELQKLNISMDDMFTVAAIISEADDRVDAFYGLPENLRQPWVERVLAGTLYGKTT